MKKLFIISAFIISSIPSFAQLNTSLFVNPAPPSSLYEWGNRKDVLTYVVVLQGSLQLQVKIKAELKLADGTIAGTTNLATAKIYSLRDGNNIFGAIDVLPLEAMLFNGKYKKAYEATGKLPADNYQLCVTLVRPADFTPVGETRCRSFNLASLQLPIPVMPLQDAVLSNEQARTAIIFRWTLVVPKPSSPVQYRVQVFPVLNDQTPMQAFRSNPPLLDKSVTGTTQYIWQPQLSTLAYGAAADSSVHKNLTFIWTIQATDATGIPLSDGNINADGRAEPMVFYIAKPVSTLKKPNKKE
jgi:hypothetical protein